MNNLPVVVTAPATEPISTAEAKLFLRVDTSDDDALIASLITAAREYVETLLWRSLITQTLRLDLRGWPTDGRFVLPRPPCLSVTSIYYTDTAGNSTEWTAASNWTAEVDREPAIIERAYNATFPTLRSADEIQNVKITYQAGYGPNATDVPDAIKQAIYLVLADFYDNRLPEQSHNFSTVERLLAAYKIR